MKKGAIFDVDGTLLDSVDLHTEAWRQAFEHFGKTILSSDIRAQIGKGGDHLMPVFLTPEELNEFGDELEKHRGDLWKRKFIGCVMPLPGARELLEGVRSRGLQVALASSSKKAELDIYKQLLRIDHLLDADTSGDDVENSKPDPDIFEGALKRLGLSGKDAIAVGDTPWDALSARRAGMDAIGVLCGGFPESGLREAGCVAVYQGPGELLANIEEWVN